MNKAKKLAEKLNNEKAKFNGCFRGTNGAMVKKDVATENGWRIEVDGKGKATSKYWTHRIKCIATKLEATDNMVEKLIKAEESKSQREANKAKKEAEAQAKAEARAKAKAEREAKKAEAEALKAEKRKERELDKELKKQQAESAKKADQEELEALRSKLRANGVDEEDLPTKSFGKFNELQCPYNQTRRSGYLFIWMVLAETPDEWVPWSKLETEALARFTEAYPEYIAKHYGEGNEYDIRRQVGVMDRSPYNAPLEQIGQRVIKSPSKGVMLISDTQGESYADYKARKRGKNVEAQLPPTAEAPKEEKAEETVNA